MDREQAQVLVERMNDQFALHDFCMARVPRPHVDQARIHNDAGQTIKRHLCAAGVEMTNDKKGFFALAPLPVEEDA